MGDSPHIAGVDICNDIDFESTLNTLNVTLNQKIKEEVKKQIAKTEQQIRDRVNSIWEQKIQRLLEVQKDYDQQIEKKLEEIKNTICEGAKKRDSFLKDISNVADASITLSVYENAEDKNELQQEIHNECKCDSLLQKWSRSSFSTEGNKRKGSNEPDSSKKKKPQ